MSATPPFADPVTLEILWNRLVSLTDEAAYHLVRSSFSTVVRESNDFACVLMDAKGDSLAQSTLSIPSFLGTLPLTTKHFIRIFGQQAQPGDVYVTNDPWLATGHLPDFTIVTPIFIDGSIVGYAGTTAHSPDVGGRMRSADSWELFEEGIRVPPSKLFTGGTPNEQLLDLLRANVRVPREVVGDLMAQVATNDLMSRRLLELFDEYGICELTDLGAVIKNKTEHAIRERIRSIPNGIYEDTLLADGYEEPIRIATRITVGGDCLDVDYAGSSPQVNRGLNTVLNYTYAYTIFALKCALDPQIPNNQGGFAPFTVTAPEGSILNPVYPAAVGGRALIGHFLPAVVFGALANVIPEAVQADSGSPLWMFTLSGQKEGGERYATTFFLNGGQGGAFGKAGVSCLSFPSNISNTPVELIEATTPVRFIEKSLVPESSGGGEFPGGAGQRVRFEVLSKYPMRAAFLAERIRNAPRGIAGGRAGASGVFLINGEPVQAKEQRLLRTGDVIEVVTPGGGGYGIKR